MARSNSSESSGFMTILSYPHEPRVGSEDCKDQLIIETLVSRSIDFDDSMKYHKEIDCGTLQSSTTSKISKFEYQKFLSASADYQQRQLIHTLIQDSGIRFHLEKIIWFDTEYDPSTPILFVNLDTIVIRLLNVVRDCAKCKKSLLICITEKQTVEHDEYYRARQILGKSLLKNVGRFEIWNEEQEECCSICLNDVTKGTNFIRLPLCSNIFHISCIPRWFDVNLSCPRCRSNKSKSKRSLGN